tara:strand:- start:387 stop:2213 length:1827 start_codon:yes stop_codon:yes gene_type:complete
MATTNSNLTINDLDFDAIKNNLKSYMSGQTAFADYNFEGAGINILLDLLAYNTHYEAFYNNMIANEMFLDSAIDRSNIVSIAKHLGYVPNSVRGSQATVNVVFDSVPGDYLPIGSVFSTTKDGTNYTFVNTGTATIDADASTGYHINDLVITEGKYESYSWIKDDKQSDQKFIIPSSNVDTTTLTVRVQNSTTDDTGYTDSWNLSTDYNEIKSTTRAYFLQEVESGKFEIYFGDGVVGKKPDDGNLITVDYLTSSGSVGNGIGVNDASGSRSFTYGSSNVVSVVSPSAGGSERESIDSIRFYAPLSYQTQGRAVTIDDYKSILINDYPDIDSISVWGGEDNDPPEYGRIIIAFKPSSGTVVSQTTKDSIIDTLVSSKNIVGLQAKIIDPNYIYIRINTEVNYNPDYLSVSDESLKTLVRNAIVGFGDTNLDKFEKGLRYSKLIKEIDNVDTTAILSNETSYDMEYRLYPVEDPVNASYVVDFLNPIYHPHDGHSAVVSSTAFSYTDTADNTTRTAFIDDDGDGLLRTWYYLGGLKTVINNNIGTIDYASGVLNINNITINSVVSDAFIKIIAQPANKDIDSRRDTILLIDSDDSSAITVTTTPSTYLI